MLSRVLRVIVLIPEEETPLMKALPAIDRSRTGQDTKGRSLCESGCRKVPSFPDKAPAH